MHFLAQVKQETRGCDYTIGCSQNVWSIEADSWDEAVLRLKDKIIGLRPDPTDGDLTGYWDNRIGYASLIQVAHEALMPVQAWYREGEAERTEIKRQEKEARERFLYEQLRQKYEEGDE